MEVLILNDFKWWMSWILGGSISQDQPPTNSTNHKTCLEVDLHALVADEVASARQWFWI